MGQQVVSRAFGVSFPDIPENMDWKTYSWVVRASVRKSVITELARAQLCNQSRMTASQIKGSFRDRYPIGKNPILRALLELKDANLLRSEKAGKKPRQKIYTLTEKGEILFGILTR